MTAETCKARLIVSRKEAGQTRVGSKKVKM